MKSKISQFFDWIVSNKWRYWIAQWILYTIGVFCSCLCVAAFLAVMMKVFK